MDSTIAFAYQPSIALLKIDTMEFDWITDAKENDKIFKQLSKVNYFDYYYINKILIIPDPIPSPRLNWSKKLIINNLEMLEENWEENFNREMKNKENER